MFTRIRTSRAYIYVSGKLGSTWDSIRRNKIMTAFLMVILILLGYVIWDVHNLNKNLQIASSKQAQPISSNTPAQPATPADTTIESERPVTAPVVIATTKPVAQPQPLTITFVWKTEEKRENVTKIVQVPTTQPTTQPVQVVQSVMQPQKVDITANVTTPPVNVVFKYDETRKTLETKSYDETAKNLARSNSSRSSVKVSGRDNNVIVGNGNSVKVDKSVKNFYQAPTPTPAPVQQQTPTRQSSVRPTAPPIQYVTPTTYAMPQVQYLMPQQQQVLYYQQPTVYYQQQPVVYRQPTVCRPTVYRQPSISFGLNYSRTSYSSHVRQPIVYRQQICRR